MKVNVKDGKFDVKVCERWDVKVDVKNVKVFLFEFELSNKLSNILIQINYMMNIFI